MKERITITIDRKLVKWIDREVRRYTFANRSHAVEYIIAHAMRKDHHKKNGKG